MATFITTLAQGSGPVRVAVKDLLDVAGAPTTAGCPAVARRRALATADAECLAGVRAAVSEGRAQIVGKANLHELAAGATGINPWYGTPRNPIDARRVPGGSSSGCAVALGAGDADVAIGTDTAGSVRIPAACCGVVGLKTTWGRVPIGGVWPLARSLDTVGPMARDVAGVVAGMVMLEPGFAPAQAGPTTVGRLRLGADARIESAVDAVVGAAELAVSEARLPGWSAAGDATLAVVVSEAWLANGGLLDDSDGVSADLREALRAGVSLPRTRLERARATLRSWRGELVAAVTRCGPLVLPTLLDWPPTMAEGDPDGRLLLCTAPVNGAGVPAISLPVPVPGHPPAGLQLIGRPGGEEELVALAALLERAAATLAS